MKTKDGSTDLENDFICNVQKRWIRIADRQWISINVLDGSDLQFQDGNRLDLHVVQ